MFRFTIRELVLVTIIAGMACAWWLDRRRNAAKAAEHQAEVVKLEATIAKFEDYALGLFSQYHRELDLNDRLRGSKTSARGGRLEIFKAEVRDIKN